MAVGIEELLSMLNEMGEAVTFLGDGVPVFKDIIADKLTVPFLLHRPIFPDREQVL